MIVATTILVLPAVSRMSFLGTPVALWKFMLVWPLPVYLLMIHDFYQKRLIHPIYLIGVAEVLTRGNRSQAGSRRSTERHSDKKPDQAICDLNRRIVVGSGKPEVFRWR